ncbi:hypothetical protein D3C71_1983350 [compost metagenome]
MQIGHHAIFHQPAAAQLVPHHHAGQQGDAVGVARQQAHERHIVHFGTQVVADAALLAHQIESGADVVVAPG